MEAHKDLPVSSNCHIVLAEADMNIQQPAYIPAFDINIPMLEIYAGVEFE
jgi:hypothetical protein